jgi:hypothetical protein
MEPLEHMLIGVKLHLNASILHPVDIENENTTHEEPKYPLC